jgi:hypothetical protein
LRGQEQAVSAEHHTHIYSAAEFHADHHSVSSSINHSKGCC